MTVQEKLQTNGHVAALNALGQTQLAKDFADAIQTQKDVVAAEGVIEYEKRPESTKARLRVANRIIHIANDILWNKRHEIV